MEPYILLERNVILAVSKKINCTGLRHGNLKERVFVLETKFTLKFSVNTRIHTYIIGHYNPSVRIIDLVSHTYSYKPIGKTASAA